MDTDGCKFCANVLSSERRSDLVKAVKDAGKDWESDVQKFIDEVNSVSNLVDAYKDDIPKTSNLFEEFRSDLDKIKPKLYSELAEIIKIMDEFNEFLRKLKSGHLPRKQSLLKSVSNGVNFQKVAKNHNEIQDLVTKHNKRSDSFSNRLSEAQNNVAFGTIEEEIKALEQLESELSSHSKKVSDLDDVLEKLSQNESELKGKASDSGAAAVAVNTLLYNYTGHKGFKLQPDDIGYKVMRFGGKAAKHLSEGERTAIALCYFLSKITEGNNKVKNSIIVIDDPISSLDTRAKNYAFSLIQDKCKDAKQLFLFTHDLHFMNEAKKWLRRRTKDKDFNGDAQEITAAFFSIESGLNTNKDNRSSFLREMPSLLRDYDSDYHYNFSIVLRNSVRLHIK